MTATDKITILVFDQEKEFAEEVHQYLQNSGFISFSTGKLSELRSVLKEKKIDLLILDGSIRGSDAIALLQEVRQNYPDLDVIVTSATFPTEMVIGVMRLGAIDFLRKPYKSADLQVAVERSRKFASRQLKLKLAENRNSLIPKSLAEKIGRPFIGVSQQSQEMLDAAMTAARYPDANVLITGESGTGKENIARIIHYSSQRKDHIFCPVNSSAITDSLLESEFFGHKKGSFTGAIADKTGFFEVCNQGTLYLDEIADMPINLQAKILRAAEEKLITPVGDTIPVQTDFRIISSTNHDIEKSVEEHRFRLDLLHRLNTFHIHIPPLRERPEDIRPILEYFSDLFSQKMNRPGLTIADEVYTVLEGYSFPGNIRELRNMTERAIMLCKNNLLILDNFPIKSRAHGSSKVHTEITSLKHAEIELIHKVLRHCKYNQKAAAEILGITRDALIRKMKKYNIIIGKSEGDR